MKWKDISLFHSFWSRSQILVHQDTAFGIFSSSYWVYFNLITLYFQIVANVSKATKKAQSTNPSATLLHSFNENWDDNSKCCGLTRTLEETYSDFQQNLEETQRPWSPDPDPRTIHLARTTPATSIMRGRAPVVALKPPTRTHVNRRSELSCSIMWLFELHRLVYEVIKHLNID